MKRYKFGISNAVKGLLVRSPLVFVLLLILPHQLNAQTINKKIKIVTTIGHITEIARHVGGDRVLVHGLIEPGIDPHAYKASESAVAKLTEADIIFYNGLDLEAKLDPLFERLKESIKTIPVGEAVPIDLRIEAPHSKGQFDPHVWLDVKLWQKVVEKVASSLADFDPQHGDEYLDRAAKYNVQLTRLDKYIQFRSQELVESQRVLVSMHNAYRYFGRRYGFEVISAEESANFGDMVDFIIKRKILVLFDQPNTFEYSSDALAETTHLRGWDIRLDTTLFSDSLGDVETFEGTYIGMLTNLLDTIINTLQAPN